MRESSPIPLSLLALGIFELTGVRVGFGGEVRVVSNPPLCSPGLTLAVTAWWSVQSTQFIWMSSPKSIAHHRKHSERVWNVFHFRKWPFFNSKHWIQGFDLRFDSTFAKWCLHDEPLPVQIRPPGETLQVERNQILCKNKTNKTLLFLTVGFYRCVWSTLCAPLTWAGRKRMVRMTSEIGQSRLSTRKRSVNKKQRDPHTALPSDHLGSPELFQVENSSENRFPDPPPLAPSPSPIKYSRCGGFLI